jgi:hypothetical protein
LEKAVRYNLIVRTVRDAIDPAGVRQDDMRPLHPEHSQRLLAATRGQPLEALLVLAFPTMPVEAVSKLTRSLRANHASFALRWKEAQAPSAQGQWDTETCLAGKATWRASAVSVSREQRGDVPVT